MAINLGGVNLQGAYNNSAGSTPLIALSGTVGGITIRDNAAPLGTSLLEVADSAGTPFVRLSATGIDGGTVNTADLNLAANSVGTGAGRIRANSPFVLGSYSATTAAYAFDYSAAETFGAFVGGGMNFSGTISATSTTFVYESFRGAPTITNNANVGFKAYTVLQALPLMLAGSLAGHAPVAPLIVNAGPNLRNTFTSARTTATAAAVNWAGQLSTTVAGAVMNCTNFTGFINAPKYSNVAGATINFGTIRAIHCQIPGVALFGSNAGTRSMTAYIGLDFDNMAAFGGNVTKVAVRSAQAAATNAYFLLHTGTAQSSLGGPLDFPNDFPNGVIIMGASGDFSMGYVGGTNGFYMQVNTPAVTQWRYSAPSANRLLMQTSTPATGEFNWNCYKFSLGAQTGAVGNQVGVFVAGTRDTSVAGEWSDFLLTQAGNITLNAAMSLVAGWTINAPSITLGTGTVTSAGALNIGGNVNQGSVNRFGVRILSNPSGGSGVNAALWVTDGNTQLDGDLTHTGTLVGLYGATPTAQSAAYTRNATIVESRTLFANASATIANNNAVLAALIADLQSRGFIG